MSIELVTKYGPYTDEIFKSESKMSLLTNTDYDFTGAHSVKIYKITTAEMNDYQRNITDSQDVTLSRFGALLDLSATTEELVLSQDRSFIFNIDKLDSDETAQELEAAKALARQIREKVVPEVDTYVYNIMTEGAGTTATPVALSPQTLYDYIIEGSEVLDDNEVPETERVLLVSPDCYKLLKKCVQFDHSDIGADLRIKGVVGMIDSMVVVKVPSSRLPANFGFLIAHPSATTAPIKLDDYGIHTDTPLSSGSIVTGRICYDAFVLDNKKMGIYYQPISISSKADTNNDGSYSQSELEALSLSELKIFAKENNITLTATTKADIITEILAALS